MMRGLMILIGSDVLPRPSSLIQYSFIPTFRGVPMVRKSKKWLIPIKKRPAKAERFFYALKD
jgi:hypothetical protein